MTADRRPPIALAACVLAGCTTFVGDTLKDPDEGDASATTAATTSGAGGEAGGLPANDPDAYLPVLDAAELCALMSECPLLAASIVASIGVPIVVVDAVDERIELSYSACLDWLASPLAPGRVGFEAQQELLFGVVAAGCSGGLDYVPIEAFLSGDERCVDAPPQYCDDDDTLVDCAAHLAVRCASPPFSAATSCNETGPESARCGIAIDDCDDVQPCDGSYAVSCEDGVLTAFDCATIGLGCSAPGVCSGEAGAAFCTPEEFGDEGCSDDEHASVCIGGFVGETDCDALGLACVAAGPARCGDAEAEASRDRCSPYHPEVDVCEGDTLHACIGGDRVDVDCAAIGRHCRAAISGESFVFSGRCAL